MSQYIFATDTFWLTMPATINMLPRRLIITWNYEHEMLIVPFIIKNLDIKKASHWHALVFNLLKHDCITLI